MTTLKANPEWLRANVKSAGIGVDRENRVINGFVVAQEGPFLEPDPRGEFDEKALRQIVALMKQNPNGTKSRLGHPTLSDDGISKFMGRAKNPRLDTVRVMKDGKEVDLLAVRADLHLSESAFENNPNGNLGEYILSRAEEDPDSFASSLVLQVDEEYRLDNHKRRKTYENGKEMPPLWRPKQIHASDLVDSGAAVSKLLAAEGMPEEHLRQGVALLDAQFAGKDKAFVESHLSAFVARYLSYRYGEPELSPEPATEQPSEPDNSLDDYLLADELEGVA